MSKVLLHSASCLAALALAGPVSAQFQAQITSPAPNTRVTAGQTVSIGFTVSGAVVGISQIVVSGERDPFGNTTFNFPPSPTTNTYTDTAPYDIPLDVAADEVLTVQITATGYADSPVSAFLTLLGPVGVPAPANDNLASAIQITGDAGTTTGTNAGATKESGEANHGGNSGGRSAWYRWTAPSDGELTVTTSGSAFDTLLGVYTGGAFPLTLVDDDDDTLAPASQVVVAVTDGTQYRIAVDGFNSGSGAANGSLTLNWSFAAAAAASQSWSVYE